MPTKHCSYANCTSDNRYPQENVFFIPFVKPHIDEVRCKKWIHATRRIDLTNEKITKYTYICSKHFIGGKGPTEENPDPVSATISKMPKARKKRPSTFELALLSNKVQKQEKPQEQNDEKISLSDMLVVELVKPQSSIEKGVEEQVSESTADVKTSQTCIKVELIEPQLNTGKSIEEQASDSIASFNSSQTCVKLEPIEPEEY